MAGRAQHQQRRDDRDLVLRAAQAVRARAARQRANHVDGHAPPVPASTWPMIGTLDALSRDASQGGLSSGLLRETRDWARRLLDELERASP